MTPEYTTYYTEELPLSDLTPGQFLAVAYETANELEWKVSIISDTWFQAHTEDNMLPFNAKIDISINSGIAHLNSSLTGNDEGDQGKNKETVERFIEKFNELKWKFSTAYL